VAFGMAVQEGKGVGLRELVAVTSD
jgi:hypothetical protein